MKRLSVLLASGALAVSAQAVNWSKLADSPTGSVFSLDLDSIESSDINIIDEKSVENITVSIRRTYPTQKKPAQKNEVQANKENNIHHSDQQLLISCKDASYYRRAYVNYGADRQSHQVMAVRKTDIDHQGLYQSPSPKDQLVAPVSRAGLQGSRASRRAINTATQHSIENTLTQYKKSALT